MKVTIDLPSDKEIQDSIFESMLTVPAFQKAIEEIKENAAKFAAKNNQNIYFAIGRVDVNQEIFKPPFYYDAEPPSFDIFGELQVVTPEGNWSTVSE